MYKKIKIFTERNQEWRTLLARSGETNSGDTWQSEVIVECSDSRGTDLRRQHSRRLSTDREHVTAGA